MVLTSAIWSFDTCGCIIEYEWDTEQDEASRVHRARVIIKDCGLHGKTKDKHDHFGVVLKENQRKNTSLAMIEEEEPTMLPSDCEWSFDEKRNLHIKLKRALAADKKARVQEKLDAKHGQGKAVID